MKWLLIIGALAVGLIWYWDDIFLAVGMGLIAPLILVAAALLFWKQQKNYLFTMYWRRWVGAILITIAVWGLLGLFTPVAGPLEETSLGGDIGLAIVGSQGILGIVRVVAITLLGVIVISPVVSWQIARALGEGTKATAEEVASASRRASEFYSRHPIHRNLADKWQKQRTPSSPKDSKSPAMLADEELDDPINLLIGDTTALDDITTDVQIGAPVVGQTLTTPQGTEMYSPTPQALKRQTTKPAMTYDEQDFEEEEDLETLEKDVAPMEDISINYDIELGEDGLPLSQESQFAYSRYSGKWILPPISLLDEIQGVELSQTEVEKRARRLEDALASYGVEARVVEVNVGPAVTQFGVEPGWDRKFKDIREKDSDGHTIVQRKEVSRTRIKVDKISNLANDLALAMAAPHVRVDAPVPGKALVGVEVPNASLTTVSLREVIESPSFEKTSSRSKLAIALGKGSGGDMVSGDLSKMPHMLIAGATGSGKTVCLDGVIASLLIDCTPEDLQLIMIDPKRVELTAFSGLPHLATPVITESDKAGEALKWLVHEMDERYKQLARLRVNSIHAYNSSDQIEKKMPYLVLVIDELADLMMAKSNEIEPLICRLAQMGRATGIHEVIATQRPSVDVITGIIKANFPTRISFAVVSQVDSRTILDTTGAEKLLGRGDMLYLPSDAPKPVRIQGCFISRAETDRLVEHWKNQMQYAEPAHPKIYVEEDPLLARARELCKDHEHISVSFLQRRLCIGSAKAQQLLERIEQDRHGDTGEQEVVGIED
ncbi:MAG: DNA translocase FtsK [Chloroflexota bacterium]|nr:DNA translocase FtsK [Chloroflexota bacterium]